MEQSWEEGNLKIKNGRSVELQNENNHVTNLECSKCERRFSRPHDLTRHNCYSEESRGLTCKTCDIHFACNKNLVKHLRRIHGRTGSAPETDTDGVKLIFKCSTCPREFDRQGSFTRHKKFCHQNSKIGRPFCKECNSYFFGFSSFNRHLRRKHGNGKDTGGKEKKSKSINSDSCSKDRDIDVEENPVHPPNETSQVKAVIDKMAKTSAQVQQETAKDGSNSVGNSSGNLSSGNDKCIVSDRDASQECRRKAEKEPVKELESTVDCETCGKIFSSKSNLKRHERSHYTKRLCKPCNRVFTVGPEWNEHLKSHKSEKNEKMFCHICGNSFGSQGGFYKHMKNHAGIFYQCEICKKKFTASHTLKNHLLKHRGEKPFICEVCGSRFSQQSHLARHSLTHSGLRKHKCDTCDKAFTDLQNLKLHQRIHTGYKPYECNLCDKKFAQHSTMRVHKKTHYMKRDFQCDICERKFSQKHSLLRHKVKHEKHSSVAKPAYVSKPTLFCNKCPRGFTSRRGLVRHMEKHTKGLLPVLKSDAIDDRNKNNLQNVSSLISSVHGHYQPNKDAHVIKDRSMDNIQIPENVNADHIKKTCIMNEKSVNTCAEPVGAMKVANRLADLHNVDTCFPLDKSLLGSHFPPDNLPKENISSIETTGVAKHLSSAHVSKGVIVATHYNENQSEKQKNDNFTLLKMSSTDNNKNYKQSVTKFFPPSAVEGNGVNGIVCIDIAERNACEMDISNTDASLRENPQRLIEVVHEIPKQPVHFQDSADGLNTLSNVICNLEDGTAYGWESFRFAEQRDLKAARTDVPDKNSENILHVVVGEHIDANTASQPLAVYDSGDKQSCLPDKTYVDSDDETINCDYEGHSREFISSNKEKQIPEVKSDLNETLSNDTEHFRSDKDDENKLISQAITNNKHIKENITVIKIKTDNMENKKRNAVAKDDEKYSENDPVRKSTDMKCKVKCLKCNENFYTYVSFKKHLKLKCGKRARTKEPKQSVDKNENITKIVTKKLSENISTEIKHETDDETEHNEKKMKSKQLKCAFCGKKFAFLNSLKFHERKHKEPAKYVCDVCGQGFYKPYYLKRHLQQHENKSGQTYFCSKCGKMFAKESLLKTHIRLHMGLDPYPCDLCSKSFRHSSNLKRHRKSHVDDTEKTAAFHSFFCDLCGKGFTARTTLQVHLNTHNGIKPYKCKLCPSEFSQSGHLIRHLKSHTGERTVKCNFCDKMFYDSATLKVHMRSHSGEKPYICSICGNSFSQVQNLKVHERTHQGIKMFKCDLCKQEFTTKMSLLRHGKRHEREGLLDQEDKGKRYMTVKKMKDKIVPCTTCDKKFTTRKSMLAHKRLVCSNEPEYKVKITLTQPVPSDALLSDGDSSEAFRKVETCGRTKQTSKHLHQQLKDSAPLHEPMEAFTQTKLHLDARQSIHQDDDAGQIHKKGIEKRYSGHFNSERGHLQNTNEQKETVQMPENVEEVTYYISYEPPEEIHSSGKPEKDESKGLLVSIENETSNKIHPMEIEQMPHEDPNNTNIIYQPASSTSVLYKDDSERIGRARNLSEHLGVMRKIHGHDRVEKIRFEGTYSAAKKLHASHDNAAESVVTFVQGKDIKKTFADVTDSPHIRIGQKNALNPTSPNHVTSFIDDGSELSIVHVVEEVPYTEIRVEEDSSQNRFAHTSGVPQGYSDSVHFSNLSHFTSHIDNAALNSSLTSPAHSLTMSSVPGSSVITPLFHPGVLGVPLNLVTLGQVSSLPIEQLPQDQYFHQEPQWRMPCP